MPSHSEGSSHQLVGYVTKMFPTFGYINNEIFFQKKCVIGPMVGVGDHVATTAVYQPNMPIKWSAEKVWRVQSSKRSRSREKDNDTSHWSERSSRHRSIERRRSTDLNRVSRQKSNHSDKRNDLTKHSEGETAYHVSETMNKRRRVSPTIARMRSPSHESSYDVFKYRLDTKELLVPDLCQRVMSVLPPVNLYRVICHWQDAFPLLKSFQPDRDVVFQLLGKADDTSSVPQSANDDGFFVKVLLLSLPRMNVFQQDIATSAGHSREIILKRIKVLAARRAQESFKAIGGQWNADVDGRDPAKNPEALINTAIRTCKDQTGIDLSFCRRWHRFLEFRYSRTEGSTARPVSVLFPGSQLWGHLYAESTDKDVSPPTKPFHRIVVYFLPDVWSLMPSAEEWPNMKKAYENILLSEGPHVFPLSPQEVKIQMAIADTQQLCQTDVTKPTVSIGLKNTTECSSVLESGQSGSGSSAMEEEPSDTYGSSGSLNQALPREMKKTGPASTQDTSTAYTDTESMEVRSTEPISSMADPEKGMTSREDAEPHETSRKSFDDLTLASMKVSELREELKARNLPGDGIKAQLISRLKAAVDKECEEARVIERKKKEETMQAVVSYKTEGSKLETEKPITDQSVHSSTRLNSKKVCLRDFPSIIVQQKPNLGFTLELATLDTISETKADLMDSETYEFIVCAQQFHDMLRRDAIFTLFRALVTAGDRGVQTKMQTLTESRRDRTSGNCSATKAVSKTPMDRIVDFPLLYSCSILDPSAKNFFHCIRVEEMFSSLGLPTSRYQLRSLVSKVADGKRIYYRSLTDGDSTPSTVKTTALFSDIDDDEYLLELIRGGDAVLDEQKDHIPPPSSVLVLRTEADNPAEAIDSSEIPTSSELVTATSEDILRHLRRSEMECLKLTNQLQKKTQEIAQLHVLTDQLPKLQEKLKLVNSTVDDYRNRLKHERERIHSVSRILEEETKSLESSRRALRHAASRLRVRESKTKAGTLKSSNRANKSSTPSLPPSVVAESDLTQISSERSSEVPAQEIGPDDQTIAYGDTNKSTTVGIPLANGSEVMSAASEECDNGGVVATNE